MRSLALLLCVISVVNCMNRDCRFYSAKNTYPFLARIMSGKDLICGGSIINNRYILTSEFCIFGREPEDLLVVVGTDSELYCGVTHLVEEVQWDFMYTRHLVSAIALLRVVEDIKFSSAIQPITLSSSTNFPVGKTATVIGWDADMCMAGEKELEIIPQENCTELYTICIWDKIDPLFSVPCYRLLGNPLTLNSIQIGIISDNTTCSFSRNSYTMVGLHIDWIKENAGRITVSAGNQVYPNTWIVLSHAILMLLSYSYSRL